MREKTLGQLADHLGVELRGDPNCVVSGISPIEKAQKGQLTFLTHKKYRQYLAETKASAVILNSLDAENCPTNALISTNPRLTLVRASELFIKAEKIPPGIHPSAVLGKNLSIDPSVHIGPQAVVGNNVVLEAGVVIQAGCIVGNDCKIGKNTTLKPRVVLYDNVRLQENCLIHSGVVLGADGFGFANHEGKWIKMPHLGGVLVCNDVEIGANTTIDRGVLEDTVLSEGVIIDNLVQIGHNVFIGKRTAIAACVAIAGSTRIGDDCLIGGGARIGGHIEVANGVHLTATASINTSISEPGIYSSGFPAKPNSQWRRNVARFQYLDDMAKRIRVLEQSLQTTS